jgi:hypothetical protein
MRIAPIVLILAGLAATPVGWARQKSVPLPEAAGSYGTTTLPTPPILSKPSSFLRS